MFKSLQLYSDQKQNYMGFNYQIRNRTGKSGLNTIPFSDVEQFCFIVRSETEVGNGVKHDPIRSSRTVPFSSYLISERSRVEI
jgi:hypothetical protein